MKPFAHLHLHSTYSVLDGFCKIDDLIEKVKFFEMPGVALTDHGVMYGAVEFWNKATAAGVNPVIGLEIYLSPRGMSQKEGDLDRKAFHLLLLAENMVGYQNLLKIASAAQLEGFYYVPRIDKDFLAKHAEGLISTTGCLSGEIPRALLSGQIHKAEELLAWYLEVFGQNNLFIELQEHENVPDLKTINPRLLDLGKKFGVEFVATNDVHYIEPDDAQYQDILLAIQTGSHLNDYGRFKMSGNSYYLRSPVEMEALFGHIPGAIENTVAIVERCSLDLTRKCYHLPHFAVSKSETAESYLRRLCQNGLSKRYGKDRSSSDEIQNRLDTELSVIHEMGFDAYFLIVWDLCQFAQKKGIWYNTRGSAAGSIVAYALEITSIEPLQFSLIFERFLQKGRVNMPDIDLDIQDDRRSEMIAYCAEKYGEDKVAQIITFGTLGARAAIRDTGRVMGIPIPEVDKIAKLVPSGAHLQDVLAESLDLQEIYEDPKHQVLLDTAIKLEGCVRNVGTHAAGVVVTDKPVVEYLPLHRSVSPGESPVDGMTQYEMSVVDGLGLLKIDFLGLVMLSVMADACKRIQSRRSIAWTFDTIPTDDADTYQYLSEGNTTGIFQLESDGITRYLMQLNPHCLEHLIAMIALYRPGPLEFIPDYIARMHGEQEVTYRHPALEPIFKDTFGIPIYQEQLMRAAMQIAGYSAGEADSLRKAIAKKNAEQLEKHRMMFVSGAVSQSNIAKETAEEIFTDWENFARYGFNLSHAAAYAAMSIKTAYLKLHYPVEYMTALLSAWQNDNDKAALYVAEARSMGLRVLPPSVNRSDIGFTIVAKADAPSIRFGLEAIKNVGFGSVQTILAAREGKPFSSLEDFCRRVDLQTVGKRSLESLILAGALDDLGDRRSLLISIDNLIGFSKVMAGARDLGQLTLFDSLDEESNAAKVQLLQAGQSGATRFDSLVKEKELLGIYVSGHPLEEYENAIKQTVSHSSIELSSVQNDCAVRVAGVISEIKKHRTQKNDLMGFITIEDSIGPIDLVLFPSVWAKYQNVLEKNNILLVDGRADVNEERGTVKVLADSLTILSTANRTTHGSTMDTTPTTSSKEKWSKLLKTIAHEGSKQCNVNIDIKHIDNNKNNLLKDMFNILKNNRGRCDTLKLRIVNMNGSALSMEFPNQSFSITSELLKTLTDLAGIENVELDIQ
jgi:DNA polymerase-3 subunit alpha